MTKDEIKKRIIQIAKREVNEDLSKINEKADLRTQINLDSMQIIELYAAIIEDFGIQVPMSVINSRSFIGLIDALKFEIDNCTGKGS